MHICHIETKFTATFGLEDDNDNVRKFFTVSFATNLLDPAAFIEEYQKLVAERNKLTAQHAEKPEQKLSEASE